MKLSQLLAVIEAHNRVVIRESATELWHENNSKTIAKNVFVYMVHKYTAPYEDYKVIGIDLVDETIHIAIYKDKDKGENISNIVKVKDFTYNDLKEYGNHYVKIKDDFINLDRIVKIRQCKNAMIGVIITHGTTYHLLLYISKEDYIQYKTFDFEEHKKWCEVLGIEELLESNEKENK